MPLSTEFGISVLCSEARPVSVNVRFAIVPDTTSVRAALEYITGLGWSLCIRSACGKGISVVGAGLLILSNCFALADHFVWFGIVESERLDSEYYYYYLCARAAVADCKILNALVNVGVSKLACNSNIGACFAVAR